MEAHPRVSVRSSALPATHQSAAGTGAPHLDSKAVHSLPQARPAKEYLPAPRTDFHVEQAAGAETSKLFSQQLNALRSVIASGTGDAGALVTEAVEIAGSHAIPSRAFEQLIATIATSVPADRTDFLTALISTAVDAAGGTEINRACFESAAERMVALAHRPGLIDQLSVDQVFTALSAMFQATEGCGQEMKAAFCACTLQAAGRTQRLDLLNEVFNLNLGAQWSTADSLDQVRGFPPGFQSAAAAALGQHVATNAWYSDEREAGLANLMRAAANQPLPELEAVVAPLPVAHAIVRAYMGPVARIFIGDGRLSGRIAARPSPALQTVVNACVSAVKAVETERPSENLKAMLAGIIDALTLGQKRDLDPKALAQIQACVNAGGRTQPQA